MTEPDNIKAVQSAYAAFGRGDVPAILAMMSDDVDWQAVVGVEPKVPTGGLRHGRSGVAEFFRQLGENLDFQQFEPREFLAHGDKVVTLGHFRAAVKSTGRSFSTDWVMVFSFHGDKVVRFREYVDAAAINAAF
jgi:ketosteroid isomerase-like protein